MSYDTCCIISGERNDWLSIVYFQPLALTLSVIILLLGRVALVAQRPMVVKLSPRTICRSLCPVHWGKTADRIRMPFGIIGRTGPGMRQVVGYGDRSTRRGTFGGEFGARRSNQWGFYGRTCATAPRRGPLPKLLWADLVIHYKG